MQNWLVISTFKKWTFCYVKFAKGRDDMLLGCRIVIKISGKLQPNLKSFILNGVGAVSGVHFFKWST